MNEQEIDKLYISAFKEFSSENEMYYNSLIAYQSMIKQILNLPLRYDEKLSKHDMFVSMSSIQQIVKNEMEILNYKNNELLNKIKTNN